MRYFPRKYHKRFQEIGEDYDKKLARLYSGALLLVALVLGLLFELNVLLLALVVIVYLLCVPQFVFNYKKYAYETKRFQDINLYMSQMAQSFIYTNDVILSLEETATCFSKGLMDETLKEAFEILDAGRWDIKLAERDALAFIESRYECEKLKNLHAFFLNTEELGGECQREFKILESMRTAWQGVVENIRIKKYWDRNIGTGIYGFFLIVCIVMLHVMRDSDLDIMHFLMTQILDAFLLIGLVLYFLFMDNRLNKSLLVKPLEMNEEQADGYYFYLENYDAKRERYKFLPLTFFSVVVSMLLLLVMPSWIMAVVALCISFVGFHIHSINYFMAMHTMKAEIHKAFPKWLFDVMLLLQRESVEGAIEASIFTAPPVMKRELRRITEMLSIQAHDPEAYMSFLSGFSSQNISEIMHKLYSLAIGANRDAKVLDVVIEKNIKSLEKAERDSMLFRDSMKSFVWIPFLCAGFGCMGYLVIAIVTSINGIIQLL